MPGMTPDAGAERSLLALAPGLLNAGIELHLALLTDRQTLVPELEDLGPRAQAHRDGGLAGAAPRNVV